jgi:DNA-directed RNA polymerase subunit RPC12/RpoP
MRPKCYFCDSELEVVLHTFKISAREEPVCEECNSKTLNRSRAAKEGSES